MSSQSRKSGSLSFTDVVWLFWYLLRSVSPTPIAAIYCKPSGRFVVTSNVGMAVHIEAPRASGTVGTIVSILQDFIIFVQYYCLTRYLLAFKREGWKLKGRGYDLSFGPAHTSIFDPPPVDSGPDVPLLSKDSGDFHVSGHIEKVSLEGQREW